MTDSNTSHKDTGSNKPAGRALTQRTVRGAMWMTASRFGSRMVALLGRVLVLATILGPEIFGLYGAAMLVLGGVEFVSRLGFEQALIQKHGNINAYLATAWTTQVIRGIALSVIVYLSAPMVAGFFDEPELLTPLRVLAIGPILMGLRSIGIVNFSRDFDFKRVCALELGTVVVQVLVGVGYALISPTIWAFVAGNVCGHVYGVLASYALSKRFVPLQFDWKRFRELFNFGFWVFVSGVLTYVLVRGGDLVVGKLVSITALGVYLMAMNLATLPTMEMGVVVTRVTLPALSILQKEPERLVGAFLRTLLITCTVVMATTAAIIALAQDFVAIALDHRWQESAALMQWLAIWGASRALGASSMSLFQAIGRPKLATIFQFAMVVAFVATVYPCAVRYGAQGVAICLAIVGVVGQMSQLAFLARVLKIAYVRIYVRVLIPISAAMFAVLAAHFARVATIEFGPFVRVACIGLALLATFTLVIHVWDRIANLSILATLKSMGLRMVGGQRS